MDWPGVSNCKPCYVCEKMVKRALFLLMIVWYLVSGCQQPGGASTEQDAHLNRDPSRLIYSKHARCRMACRHIDESEVQEILQQGRINERKSEPASRPDPKYALEGRTRDGQEVRIVFAMAKRGIVVVTVIDLDTEWTCNCK